MNRKGILPCAGEDGFIVVGMQMKQQSTRLDAPTLHQAWLNFVATMAAHGWPEDRLYFVFALDANAPQYLTSSFVIPPQLNDGKMWSRVAILSADLVPITARSMGTIEPRMRS